MDPKIATVLNQLSQVIGCDNCGTRLRFGDVECPHCGTDIDPALIRWAQELINLLEPQDS